MTDNSGSLPKVLTASVITSAAVSTAYFLLFGGLCTYLFFVSAANKNTGVQMYDGYIAAFALIGACCISPPIGVHAATRWTTLVGVRRRRGWGGVMSVVVSVLEALFGGFGLYIGISGLLQLKDTKDVGGQISALVMVFWGFVLLVCGVVSAVAAIMLLNRGYFKRPPEPDPDAEDDEDDEDNEDDGARLKPQPKPQPKPRPRDDEDDEPRRKPRPGSRRPRDDEDDD